MARKTSIRIGSHFQRFIQRQLESGRYATASEVISAGLRILEDDLRLQALQRALEYGESSGLVEDFNIEVVLNAAE